MFWLKSLPLIVLVLPSLFSRKWLNCIGRFSRFNVSRKAWMMYVEEEDGRHIITLMDAGGVVELGSFFTNFYFDFAVSI